MNVSVILQYWFINKPSSGDTEAHESKQNSFSEKEKAAIFSFSPAATRSADSRLHWDAFNFMNEACVAQISFILLH